MWLGYTGRSFGVRPSELLKIEDEVLALDFDLAAGLRLLDFDKDVARAERTKLAAAIWGKDLEAEAEPDIQPSHLNGQEQNPFELLNQGGEMKVSW